MNPEENQQNNIPQVSEQSPNPEVAESVHASQTAKRRGVVWALSVLGAAVVFAGGYYLFFEKKAVCWPYCPSMTEVDREQIKQSALDAETANWQTYRNEEYGVEYRYPNIYDETNPWMNSMVKKPRLNITRNAAPYDVDGCFTDGNRNNYEHKGIFVLPSLFSEVNSYGSVIFCVNKRVEHVEDVSRLSLYYSTRKDDVYYTFLFFTDCFGATTSSDCTPFDEEEGKRWAETIVSTFKFISSTATSTP